MTADDKAPIDATAMEALLQEFFRAVSFAPNERPSYETLRELFIEDGRLIWNSAGSPNVETVDGFIAPRQAMVDSGELTSFHERELRAVTEIFGNVAHRFSTYEKSGVSGGAPFANKGMISTQFVWTVDGWRISSMAWDDQRPGLTITDRYA
jgi:hypothetical protein